MNLISSLNIFIELGCLLSAIYFLRGYEKKKSLVTIAYLMIVCLTEITALYFKLTKQPNSRLYNIFIIFEATYISYGLYVALKFFTKKAGLFCIGALVIFGLSYIVESMNTHLVKFNSKTILITSIVFSLISFFYFYLLIKYKKPINLKLNSAFWWVAGVYVYYFGGTIYNLFLQNLIKSNLTLTCVMIFLNLLLYSIWTYSFICSSRLRN